MKRKVKVLTLAEIKEKMVHGSAEHWPHSEPHLGLLPGPEGLSVLPLSPLAENGLMVLFLVDMADYAFHLVLDGIESLHARLKDLPWEAVIAVEEKYSFSRNTAFLDRYRVTRSFSNIPLFYDQKGDWFSHFKAPSEGRIVILFRGKEILSLPLLPDFPARLMKLEGQLHEALRIDDPGLPLPEITRAAFSRPHDLRKIPASELILGGNWVQAGQAVATEDSQATLSFPFQGYHARIIATTHGNSRETSRFSIFFNEEPLPSAHFGPAVRQGEKGAALGEINKSSGIFEIIHSNVEMKGVLKIRLLSAVETPVIIYGVRTA